MSFQLTSRLTAALVGSIACCLTLSTVEHAMGASMPQVAGSTPAAPHAPTASPAQTAAGGAASFLALSSHLDSVFGELFGSTADGMLSIDGFVPAPGVYLGSMDAEDFFAIVVDINPSGYESTFEAEMTLKTIRGEVATHALIVIDEAGGSIATVIPLDPASFSAMQLAGADGAEGAFAGAGNGANMLAAGGQDPCVQYDCQRLAGPSCEDRRNFDLCIARNAHNLRMCAIARGLETANENAWDDFLSCLYMDAELTAVGTGVRNAIKACLAGPPWLRASCIALLVGCSLGKAITCIIQYRAALEGADHAAADAVATEQRLYRLEKQRIWNAYWNCAGATGDPVPDFPRFQNPHPVEVNLQIRP